LNQRGNVPPLDPLQCIAWRSDANCRPGPTINMAPLSTPLICLQQYEMKENHAYYSYKE